MLKTELVVIDPQFDFCDPNGALYVPGADEDCVRLANMIQRIGSKLTDIHVTLDTHHRLDVAHPLMWRDSNGNMPAPFTLISVSDVESGTWIPVNPGFKSRLLEYVKSLETNNRYVLCVWPEHCLIGSVGHAVYEPVRKALSDWEDAPAMIDYVTKGSNIFTEHYSAVQADVPDPTDPTTQLNTRLLQTVKEADIILATGQALSHCVASTFRDIANNFGEENIKKIHLLEDTTSSVPGFEQLGDDFLHEMIGRGMVVTTSDKVLS